MIKNKVLSVTEMQNLISKGINISNASMCWVNSGNGDETGHWSLDVMRDEYQEFINNKNPYYVPAFTLDDILEILPKQIQPFLDNKAAQINDCDKDAWQLKIAPMVGTNYFFVKYVRNDYVPKNNGYCGNEYHRDDPFMSFIGSTGVEAAYKMLLSCIEHKYV